MTLEELSVGQKVRINAPGNSTLHNETGTICDLTEDGPRVRFDVYKSKFDRFEDSSTGSVIVGVNEIVLL